MALGIMAQTSSSSIPVLTGIEALASNYDVFFCDVWGVLHNGVRSFVNAVDALSRVRAAGGVVVLVSNAPRPNRFVLPQLAELGVSSAAFDALLTSGDVSSEEIALRAGQRVYHIGPERDLALYKQAGAQISSLEEADYVVCTGLFNDDTDTVEDYRATLEVMRARNLWLLCGNPDLVVERGNQIILCAGSIAAAYEQMGGEVCWAGKPYAPIYEKALERAEAIAGRSIAKNRILAIGDAIRTDIAGAVGFGVDSLMIARGIHAEILGVHEGEKLSPEPTRAWLEKQAFKPHAIIDELVW